MRAGIVFTRRLVAGEESRIGVDDEVVHTMDLCPAHSPNDVVVLFEKRRLLAVGDLVWENMHPILFDSNTDLKSWITYLERLDKEFDIRTWFLDTVQYVGRILLRK
jgi:glyoxylase-like metal-dependent hydrolase (beta-lactamase superfamily II)